MNDRRDPETDLRDPSADASAHLGTDCERAPCHRARLKALPPGIRQRQHASRRLRHPLARHGHARRRLAQAVTAQGFLRERIPANWLLARSSSRARFTVGMSPAGLAFAFVAFEPAAQ
jgi:hypothetical protein